MNDVINDIKNYINTAIADNIEPSVVRDKLSDFLILLSPDKEIKRIEEYEDIIFTIYNILFEPKIDLIIPSGIRANSILDYIFKSLMTIRDTLSLLSSGDLSFNYKMKGYVLGSLKMLQSNLRHLTWQVQMVSGGDFTQKVDFMGEFSTAFNRMAVQLDTTICKLKKHEVELEKLNATKDKFFSIMSHDLRGPIGSFKSTIDLITEHFDNISKEETMIFLNLMKESSNHLFTLLDNLLIWSRSQRGHIIPQPEFYDLSDIVGMVNSYLKLNADSKKIELLSLIPKSTNIYTDINQLTVILRNIISNAIKFTHENGKIVIDTEKNSCDEYIIITIMDNGIGMDTLTMEKLFHLDVQITNKGTSGETGTGLGLIICKEFIEKLGGEIWVESELGKGSKFFIKLPKNEKKDN